MSENKRCYTHLKKSMSPESLNSFCKKIALEYAKSNGEFARSYFCKQYMITAGCFYRILKKVVIEHLISENMVNKMEEKCLLNQKAHAKNAGLSTAKYYAQLRAKRNEYTINFYLSDVSKIKELVEDFANSPEISKKDFCLKYDISYYVLDNLLVKAIVDSFVDDDIFHKIQKRSLKRDSSMKAKLFFEELNHIRNTKKTAQI